jgi:hypothetical protein
MMPKARNLMFLELLKSGTKLDYKKQKGITSQKTG